MGELIDSSGEMWIKGRGLLNKMMMAVLRRGSCVSSVSHSLSSKAMSSAAFAVALGCLKRIPRVIESPDWPSTTSLFQKSCCDLSWYEGTSHLLVSEPAQCESAPAALDIDSWKSHGKELFTSGKELSFH